jgi:hypothetical protein
VVKKLLLSIIFLVLCAHEANAATYWVSPNGTSGGCVNSATQPVGNQNFRTIDDFRHCMAIGDTAMFIPGTYDLPNVDRWDLPINAFTGTTTYTVIRGSTGNRNDVIMNCTGTGGCVHLDQARHSYIEFAHMTFLAGQGPNIFHTFVMKFTDGAFNEQNPCFTCGPHHIRLRNVKIDLERSDAQWAISPIESNTQENCILNGAPFLEVIDSEIARCAYGIYQASYNVLVENTWIHHNRGYGIHSYNENHPQVDNNIYRGNLIEDNARIPEFSFSYAAAVIIARGDNNHFYNNVCRRNGPGHPNSVGSGGCLQISAGSSNTFAYNNTIYDNSWGGASFQPATSDNAFITNNIMFNNCTAPQGFCEEFFLDDGGDGQLFMGPNLIGVNPLLTSANDARLTAGSPARNAGVVPAFALTNTDANGVTRPQEDTWDMGACEFFAGAEFCPSLISTGPSIPQPTITITSPTTNPTFTTSSNSITVSGNATPGSGSSDFPLVFIPAPVGPR